MARGGKFRTLAHHLAKRGAVGDDMVGRHHQQHRVGAIRRCRQGGQREGGCGIAANRFQDHRARLAHQSQLFRDDKAVLLVAHHHRCRQIEPDDALGAAHRGLQQRIVANQRQQLLGILLARQGPQAGTGATGQDNGQDHHVEGIAVGSGVRICQPRASPQRSTALSSPWYRVCP